MFLRSSSSVHWGFRDRKETDALQLIYSVSLIAKRSGFSRTRDDERRRLKFGI